MRQRASIDLFVGGVAFIAVMAVAAFSPRVFIDGDTNWHVAAGRWILAHHTVPQTDPFSYTYAGKPWVAHEWGAEVLMTLAYYAGAWSGVVLLIGLAAGAAYAMIAAELRLWMGPVGQAIGLALSKPLTRVPENTLKFVVGLMLTSFGIFWTGEGLGVDWPGGDLTLLGIVVIFALLSGLAVRWLKPTRRAQLRVVK